ncbi:E3 ubiquitin-protein ligase RING1 [Bienertia sinuspersici]
MRAEQQEIAIDSDTDEGGDFGVEEAIRDLEWEILLAVNNFNREVYDMDFNVDMYEAILGEVEDRMNEWRGSPPTAESIIENLPSVLPSHESSEENEVVCAICKDGISEEVVVKQLPCLHYYHGECIIPWLRMRNTCPVCRHELPTDDAEYEYRKRQREREEMLLNIVAHEDLTQDSEVRPDFHVFL